MTEMENEKLEQNKIKIISSYISIGIFLFVVMGLFLLTIIKPDKEFSENENRVLAQRTDFSFKSLLDGSFTKDYETYITDQFVARDNFIAMKVYSERMLLKKTVNGVYFAPEHYLIEEHKQEDIDHSLETKNLERVAEFMKANKGTLNVKFMLVPTVSNVYPEWLPGYNLEYDQNALFQQAENVVGADSFIDTSKILNENKKDYLFYRTDHHWTSLGAYYGYQAWAEQNNIEYYPLEAFDRQVVSKDFLGTTYSKVNVNEKADEIELYTLKNGPQLKLSLKPDNSEQKDGIYEMERLQEKDKYTVFLGGNHPYVEIDSDVHNGKTLLLVSDSYAHCMVPFLANHYEKIILVDYRYFNNSTKKLMEEKQVEDVLILYNAINFVTDKSIIKLNK